MVNNPLTQPHTSRWKSLNALNSKRLSPNAIYGYIPGLDGVRAIAVLIVILAHFGLENIIPGGFGVTLFFFISGFLITRLLIAEREAKGQISLKQFYIRRFIRLYPALLFMVLGSSALFIALGIGGPSFWEFTSAIGYGANIFQVFATEWNLERFMSWTHLWSLAVEEHFYFLFPILAIMCGLKWNRLGLALGFVILTLPLWRLYLAINFPDMAESYSYMMTDARIDSIAWGCLLSVLLHQTRSIEKLRLVIGWPVIIACLSILLITFVYRDPTFRTVWRYSLQGLALYGLFLNLFYLHSVDFSFSILEWSPLAWIGKISYALYLWHYPVYDLVLRHTDFSLAGTIFVAFSLSLMIAAFSFYLVEKPFSRLRKRFGSYIPARATA